MVKIKGVPEKGKVNQNLVAFFAETLQVAKSRITIVSGSTSRLKRLEIEGFSLETIREKLSPRN